MAHDSVISAPPHIHTHTNACVAGHNSGKTYIHRLGDDVAQEWLDTLKESVRDAKSRAEMAELEAKYGQSRWTLLRYGAPGFRADGI